MLQAYEEACQTKRYANDITRSVEAADVEEGEEGFEGYELDL